MPPAIGDLAPDFTLRNQHGADVTLSSFRSEKNVLLMFYPFAFTGTCTGELAAIRKHYAELSNDHVAVLSVSCDSVFSLRVFADQEHLTHDLLSDFWPHGAVAREYGVFREDRGSATRGSFVIDRAGLVRWAIVNSVSEARNVDDYIEALAVLG